MGRLAAMAEAHYKEWMSGYQQIKNKPEFFQRLEDEAEDQIAEMAESLYQMEKPPPQTYQEEVSLRTASWAIAESAVIRELILPEPTNPTTPDPALDAWDKFHAGLGEIQQQLDELRERQMERSITEQT